MVGRIAALGRSRENTTSRQYAKLAAEPVARERAGSTDRVSPGTGPAFTGCGKGTALGLTGFDSRLPDCPTAKKAGGPVLVNMLGGVDVQPLGSSRGYIKSATS